MCEYIKNKFTLQQIKQAIYFENNSNDNDTVKKRAEESFILKKKVICKILDKKKIIEKYECL